MIRSVSLPARAAVSARPREFHAPVPQHGVFLLTREFTTQRSLERLLRSAGHQVHTFPSASDFLRRVPADAAGCVIVDDHRHGASALDVLNALGRRESALQTVVINGSASVPLTVEAMRRGASDVLTKPVHTDQLFDAVATAVAASAVRADERSHVMALRARYDTLTPRQREVCALVVRGLLNKQIAWELGTSEKTVKAHRAAVMSKLRAGSVAELVRVVDRVTVPGADSFGAAPEWRVQSPLSTRQTIHCA